MSRPAINQNSNPIGEQTNTAPPTAQQWPWTKPWWYVSQGNGPALFYIVTIHLLAIVGIILFPLPSWRVLAVAVAITSMGGIGTSVCYHRCLSHRSLRLNRVVEQALI